MSCANRSCSACVSAANASTVAGAVLAVIRAMSLPTAVSRLHAGVLIASGVCAFICAISAASLSLTDLQSCASAPSSLSGNGV